MQWAAVALNHNLDLHFVGLPQNTSIWGSGQMVAGPRKGKEHTPKHSADIEHRCNAVLVYQVADNWERRSAHYLIYLKTILTGII